MVLLTTMDNSSDQIINFEGLRSYIIDRLETELDSKLIYHSLQHTLNVEQAVIKYCQLEGLNHHDSLLIRTAALFHDAGFIVQYENNEHIGVNLFNSVAKTFGYSEEDMLTVERLIMVTMTHSEPKDILEEVMCDADLDYLGRADYHTIANNLFIERQHYGITFTEKEWLSIQINYLEHTHHYYTKSAKHKRGGR